MQFLVGSTKNINRSPTALSPLSKIVIYEVFLRFADIRVCSLDNASDPGVCAKQMWIDVVEEKGQLCLTFTDNGCGMTPSKLHKMLR